MAQEIPPGNEIAKRDDRRTEERDYERDNEQTLLPLWSKSLFEHKRPRPASTG